ncbi:MAG: glycosyltransferase family 4 protein [Cellulophaga sp.]
MRILYIHQYFTTPDEPGGTRSYWIGKELVNNGHDVSMLTTNTRLKGNTKRKVIDGMNVTYLNIPYSSHMSIFKRLLSFLKFMTLSTLMVLREKKYDLIIATSTPLTVGFPALVARKIKKTPYIFEVRDLWPEVPIQMGGLKNNLVIKLAKSFEKTIYKNAKHIVALSPGMQDGIISTGISKEKTSLIPNMSKIDKFWSRKKNMALINEFELDPNSFKVIYFGSMGIANGMEYIINAAKQINPNENIEFVFLGGGATEEILQKRCKDENIPNMNFYGYASMERLSEIVNICDVSLVTFANLPILATNSPNKLFDSLSAGKPIIVNSNGWTKEMVEKYDCGIFVDPTTPNELAKQIITLKNNPKLCEKMGRNSRKLAEEKFDKSILCKQFSEVVNNLQL